jgi:hypothetical protein
MSFFYTCEDCEQETELNYRFKEDALRDIRLGLVKCRNCKAIIPRFLRREDLYGENEPKDKEYDDEKDKYSSLDQLWRSAEIVKRFSINMRLDPVTVGVSTVNSVVRTRATDPNFRKRTDDAKVLDCKGGRQNGATVMGGPARDIRNLVLPVQQLTHQDDEWLHLWGDNLGGPSIPANFVAGSYAANTEMLVIEQALALNSPLTQSLDLRIVAQCSALHFGEYLTYRVKNPKRPDKLEFSHLIDLRNQYFTAANQNTVNVKIGDWLRKNKMCVPTLI